MVVLLVGGEAKEGGREGGDRGGERERERERDVPAHTKDPGHCNKFSKSNKQQRNSGSKLIKQLKQIDTVAKDKWKCHQEEEETDNG